MCRSYHFIIGLIMCIAATKVSVAQFQLPRFDVEVKGGIAVLSADQTIDKSYYVKHVFTTNLMAGAHWQLNQNIGIGWIYAKSLSGKLGYDAGGGTAPADENIYMMMNGPDIRISTGRTKKWRPYLSLNYLTFEFINQKNGFRLATSTKSFGSSLGIMRRISNKVYWNVIELSFHALDKDAIYWLTKSDFFAEAKMGVTVNFGKRK